MRTDSLRFSQTLRQTSVQYLGGVERGKTLVWLNFSAKACSPRLIKDNVYWSLKHNSFIKQEQCSQLQEKEVLKVGRLACNKC
jgi:hypothetical protein